nr:MAG TPA: hypothetical protein [Caudoviricetes sp.]
MNSLKFQCFPLICISPGIYNHSCISWYIRLRITNNDFGIPQISVISVLVYPFRIIYQY